jgi:hypothetical protein
MCLRRAPEEYITGAMSPVGAALDRAGLLYLARVIVKMENSWTKN